MFMEVLGVPPKEMIERSTRKKKFFEDQTLEPKPTLNSKGKPRKYGSKTLESVMKCKDKEFCSFVKLCLEW
jgi:dual specificity tyrosine-phosphorylation-regulated kinase 2/3/4